MTKAQRENFRQGSADTWSIFMIDLFVLGC